MLKSCLTSYCTLERSLRARTLFKLKTLLALPPPFNVTISSRSVFNKVGWIVKTPSLDGDSDSSLMHRWTFLVKSAKWMSKLSRRSSGKRAQNFHSFAFNNRTEHIKYLLSVNKRILLANSFSPMVGKTFSWIHLRLLIKRREGGERYAIGYPMYYSLINGEFF